MKKNQKTTRTLFVVLVFIVMLTLIAVSGTYAKYTTSLSGKATAVVARWAFKASDKDGTQLSESFEIDLAKTADEGTVVDVDGVKKIQPGSKGTIEITIDNSESDVDATLDVKATDAKGLELSKDQFTVGAVTIEDAADNKVKAGTTAKAKVTWEWLYNKSEDADTEDTTKGKAADGAKLDIVNFVITGTQVNPNPLP